MAGLNKAYLADLLLAPIVTEKANRQSERHRQYVFRVRPQAAKPEIREAVEQLFEVRVQHVRVCNMRGKRRVFKGQPGRTRDWKKAYVQLRPGFNIDLLSSK